MGFRTKEVKDAVDAVEDLLGFAIPSNTQEQYETGREICALSYDKLQQSTGLPILTRYIVAARSYLHQPSPYYDIFRACRATIYIQLLVAAVESLSKQQVNGLPDRLERLKTATDYDAFDSVLF